jgi:hypothetical protein
VCHAASAIVVPLAVAAMALGSETLPRRRRIVIAALSPLGVGCAFLIERQGVPGGLAGQPGVAAKLDFALAQFATLGKLVLKPPGGPLLLWAFLHEAAAALLPARWRGARLVLATLPVALALALAARGAAAAAVLLALLLSLAVGVSRAPLRWFLAVWAAIGVLLFVATPERNASYMRHFIVPCLLLAGGALSGMASACIRSAGRLGRRLASWRLEWMAAAATGALVAAVTLAAHVPIPMLSSRVHQVRYVGDLGLNFRAALESVLVEIPPGGELAFFAGRSRDDEMRSLYGVDYFARLQPAKSEHYDDFTAVLGRPDVQVSLVDPESGTLPPGRWFLAVNDWEIERARVLCGCEPRRIFERDRARAGLFRPAP